MGLYTKLVYLLSDIKMLTHLNSWHSKETELIVDDDSAVYNDYHEYHLITIVFVVFACRLIYSRFLKRI